MSLKTLLVFFVLGASHCQDVITGAEEDMSCTLEDGTIGECVSYFLCHANKTINDVGLGVIDIRAGGDDDEGGCKSYLDLCCKSDDTQETPITPKPDLNLQPQGCGFRNPSGVGFGTIGDVDGEAKFGEFPWVVAILKIEPVKDDEPDGAKLNLYVGGGSLIHPRIVLTAAHYVALNKTFRIRAGEWDTQTTKEIYAYQEREILSKEIHQNFNNGTLFFDVALLFLNEPIDMAPNVGMACLPPPGQIMASGTRCFATGWGREKFNRESSYQTILKKIDVPVVERTACQVALRKTRLGRHFKLHTSFMCAGGEKDKDACRGDGGSPLSCPIEVDKDRYVQTGIVAWGIGCGEEGIPGVYVDVAYLRNWIDEKVIAKGYNTTTYTI